MATVIITLTSEVAGKRTLVRRLLQMSLQPIELTYNVIQVKYIRFIEMGFKAVKKQNVVDVVYEQIKNNISNDTWVPGEKMPSEPQLASMFQVSRVSIRSAVQKLRDLGVVVTYQGKGTFIAENLNKDILLQDFSKPIMHLSENEFFDMLTFRKTVEFKCIELAVQNSTDEDLIKIENALSRMWLFTHDFKKYSAADYEFHMAIVAASKNSVFVKAMMLMKETYLFYLEEINRVFGISKESVDAHRDVYIAIQSGDSKKAIAILDDAMGNNVDALVKHTK